MNLLEQKKKLNFWKEKVASLKTLPEKSNLLDAHTAVQAKLFSNSSRFAVYQKCTDIEKYVLKSIFVIGEDDVLFPAKSFEEEKIKFLLKHLIEVESFYEEIGGIIGYQYSVLNLMISSKNSINEERSFFPAPCIDVTQSTEDVREKIRLGIECLPQMAEFYALGGAADRLHLQDPKSGNQLPAAMMRFNRKSLLESLIDDLKAREYLYEKLFSKKLIIPIGIMTSNEKNNHQRVISLCEKNNWFGRPRNSFFFFTQPSVPVIDQNGRWVIYKPYSVLLKPGGHGAIWKLAKNKGVFQWMKAQGKTKAIIRQINNPIAGIDYGLLVFYGYGISGGYHFGFASCARRVNSAEGVNVLVEKKVKDHYEYILSNIEYCEFKKHKIKDVPLEKGGKYSMFSSNTNLLFADLNVLEDQVKTCPFPGMLINFKPMTLPNATNKKVFAGRLETTMQNIADTFREKTQKKHVSFPMKKIFATYNHRHKTISTTKKVYIPGKHHFETPEKCFYDYLKNHYDLLVNYCNFQLPKFEDFETYLKKGPSFLVSYLPSLGPLYSVICQKIHTGVFHERSEMVMNLSEVLVRNLHLNGSLFIQANDTSGWCILKNVRVENEGVNYENSHFWRGDICREGCLKIILSKRSGFYAENITFSKNQVIEVGEGEVIKMTNAKQEVCKVKNFKWKYFFDNDNKIKLQEECYMR